MRRTAVVLTFTFESAMSNEKENKDPSPSKNPSKNPSKKRRLSLSRKSRFKSISEDRLTAMSKPNVPKKH